MAEGEGFDRRRAVSLLQEATRLIGEYSGSSDTSTTQFLNSEPIQNAISQGQQQHHQRTDNINQRQNISGSTESNTSSTPSPSLVNSVRERSLGNFRDLFAPYGSSNRRSLSSSHQSAHPPSKRKKQNAVPKFKVCETWTHTFFCLANREQIVAPSTALKTRLQQAGLGRKKICFNWKATAAEVKTKLEEIYPKLENGGGFEIMRRGPQANELMVIQSPRRGYSVPYL
ncbi:Hypothetical predicted protein [Paramuricea clavata]|uniref:Uncharacterized protein n=1 Tax=Paramuricea clavata TaxID=317549 RepID=A0A7D9JMC6_PARCT|nr:Hypothetical predicted protein [Paramuricea clavata]